ncbi:twin-arginine translocase TatA/TatE family subunit [Dehalogenimonas formicexedens]|uniref:Sec-independent protein translocase protein TatA n=2 Tax=Dehalogenimonas TaxID=670486 RepID=A0A1P8F9D3_9CHLR|nr:twin-arginine translocase TatA/TatE family subunit [Dehalogenimonas formicexedens]APV45076.1 sec-independent protein translocase protein TatA [Dehalogenimonas formicexedens]
MNFFGLGTFEIVTILIVATLVFGPNRIPEFAKKAGEFMRSFQKITSDMTKEFTKAIDSSPTKPSDTGKPPDSFSGITLDKYFKTNDK